MRANLAGGLDLSGADYTQLSVGARADLAAQRPRALSLAQISRPWQAPGWFM
jgi:LPS-assembly protein